jgi:hypothetical protein
MMSSEHEQWSDLLPWYANETLDEHTRAALEAHLRDCPTCRRELAIWRRISTAVHTQPATALPSTARRRLLALARPQPWGSLRLVPLLLRSQLLVIRAEIWPASALVFALGLLVTLATCTQAGGALPFVLTAPIVAALGVAFIYGPAVDPALEVELATPTSPHLVLLARLVLVFGFDLALGLAGSLALALLRPGLSLWLLVSAWLSPMAFLSTLSLLLSVLSADPGLGMLVSLVLWAVHSVGRIADPTSLPWRILDLTTAAVRPWLWALALLMGSLALWASEREERWLRART